MRRILCLQPSRVEWSELYPKPPYSVLRNQDHYNRGRMECRFATTLELLRRARTMRLHGINRDVFDRYTSNTPRWFYEVVAPGIQVQYVGYRGGHGHTSATQSHRFLDRRREIAGLYSRALLGLPLKNPKVLRPDDVHSWHLYVIQLELESLTIDRAKFIELMAQKGLDAAYISFRCICNHDWRTGDQSEPR